MDLDNQPRVVHFFPLSLGNCGMFSPDTRPSLGRGKTTTVQYQGLTRVIAFLIATSVTFRLSEALRLSPSMMSHVRKLGMEKRLDNSSSQHHGRMMFATSLSQFIIVFSVKHQEKTPISTLFPSRAIGTATRTASTGFHTTGFTNIYVNFYYAIQTQDDIPAISSTPPLPLTSQKPSAMTRDVLQSATAGQPATTGATPWSSK
ncbi:uncharacterized protein LACBIDRAFT_328848 [Laccaria bicolor S238N-H82]|uniref:Predicted protein n=1 Tax=Laccaria bicolor (strain S238N-H82 / ATCC MYA-4686) TaxID=486041 RepID=B0DG66_LACBS|nr:uncharacterized protein LACBIDRAFT_328848 [Laccaria bicolor S238N-H82]EDR06590.1 predicted protein [Laccaria bicolor S238N-H82]|eukprot:XP_001882962.1 predicted protein [Laccaria bicolor S238N-H82]